MNKKSALTMGEIAKKLGLSRMAVSAVVNGKCKERGFSKETEEKVNAFLKKQGFVPSKYASKLRKGETGGVGILFNSEFYPMMMYSLEKVLKELRKTDSVELIAVKNEDTIKGLQELAARRVSQLVWFQSLVNIEQEHPITEIMPYISNFSQKIIYNYNFGGDETQSTKFLKEGVDLVGLNLDLGYRDLCRHLKESGHKKVVALLSHAKFEVFKGNGIDVEWIPSASPELDDYAKMVYYADSLVELKKSFDFSAVYYHDYQKALYLIDILRQKGYKVPEDISVWGYGFNTHPFFPVAKVSMLNIPIDKMIQRVIQLLKDEKVKNNQYCYNHEILDAGSHKDLIRR